ncbi:hypothetical protein PCL_11265 [Purpureocillium lilacinum]|uniref:Adiponectin receptor protein 1 n=1 Tax=Purpureocillium lilacinum TaxID=33203 RepID=A0A2U3DPZ7_PURLI|nr:hypothetical protein PCL_11265 [Purpureocillium lilacinum]
MELTEVGTTNTFSQVIVNIWSHLIGAVKFLHDFVGFLNPMFASAGITADGRVPDVVAISLYYLSVIACFGLSTTFHVFSDHSPRLHLLTNQLDHLGIVLVMWSTGVSGGHFALQCTSTTIRTLYLSMLTFVAACCGLLTLRSRFRQPEFRRERFSVYILLGISLFGPFLHGWSSFGSLERLNEVAGLRSFLQLTMINTLGGVLYATRIPERWFSGTFDLIGNSHNCMHIMAIGGATIRLRGLLAVRSQDRPPEGIAAWKSQSHWAAKEFMKLRHFAHRNT